MTNHKFVIQMTKELFFIGISPDSVLSDREVPAFLYQNKDHATQKLHFINVDVTYSSRSKLARTKGVSAVTLL